VAEELGEPKSGVDTVAHYDEEKGEVSVRIGRRSITVNRKGEVVYASTILF
jgi:hypothetical protein